MTSAAASTLASRRSVVVKLVSVIAIGLVLLLFEVGRMTRKQAQLSEVYDSKHGYVDVEIEEDFEVDGRINDSEIIFIPLPWGSPQKHIVGLLSEFSRELCGESDGANAGLGAHAGKLSCRTETSDEEVLVQLKNGVRIALRIMHSSDALKYLETCSPDHPQTLAVHGVLANVETYAVRKISRTLSPADLEEFLQWHPEWSERELVQNEQKHQPVPVFPDTPTGVTNLIEEFAKLYDSESATISTLLSSLEHASTECGSTFGVSSSDVWWRFPDVVAHDRLLQLVDRALNIHSHKRFSPYLMRHAGLRKVDFSYDAELHSIRQKLQMSRVDMKELHGSHPLNPSFVKWFDAEKRLPPSVSRTWRLDWTPLDNDCLVYMHIPKTAGSSMRDCIQSSLLKMGKKSWSSYVLLQRPSNSDTMTNAAMFTAHVGIGFREELGKAMPTRNVTGERRCEYITQVRDPIERVISAYFYHKNPANPTAYKDCIEKGKGQINCLVQYSNDIVRRLSGDAKIYCNSHPAYEESLPRAQTTDAQLAKAMMHAEFDVRFVSMQQQLGLSSEILHDAYGLGEVCKMPSLVKSNRISQRNGLIIDAAALRSTVETNELDLRLYEHLCELFEDAARRCFACRVPLAPCQVRDWHLVADKLEEGGLTYKDALHVHH